MRDKDQGAVGQSMKQSPYITSSQIGPPKPTQGHNKVRMFGMKITNNPDSNFDIEAGQSGVKVLFISALAFLLPCTLVLSLHTR